MKKHGEIDRNGIKKNKKIPQKCSVDLQSSLSLFKINFEMSLLSVLPLLKKKIIFFFFKVKKKKREKEKE